MDLLVRIGAPAVAQPPAEAGLGRAVSRRSALLYMGLTLPVVVGTGSQLGLVWLIRCCGSFSLCRCGTACTAGWFIVLRGLGFFRGQHMCGWRGFGAVPGVEHGPVAGALSVVWLLFGFGWVVGGLGFCVMAAGWQVLGWLRGCTGPPVMRSGPVAAGYLSCCQWLARGGFCSHGAV